MTRHVLIVAIVLASSCSAWRPYRQPVDRQVHTDRGSVQFVDGECVRPVTTTTTTIYDRAYRFRTGPDLYIGAAATTLGWIFIGSAFLDQGDPDYQQLKRDRLTAGFVLMGFSAPFWGYFFIKLLNRPQRDIRAIEEIKVTEDLVHAKGC